MARKHNDLDAGLLAFQDALKPQEGAFMRGATWIMNAPKDFSDKPHRSPNKPVSDNERVASALLQRNAQGRFVKGE